MRFRLGLVTGLATGYYLGARAGRKRYEQINRAMARLRRTDAYEDARERARAAVEEVADKAKAAAVETAEKALTAVGLGDSDRLDDTAPDLAGPGPGPVANDAEPPGYSSSR